jgi:hypothetical protein
MRYSYVFRENCFAACACLALLAECVGAGTACTGQRSWLPRCAGQSPSNRLRRAGTVSRDSRGCQNTLLDSIPVYSTQSGERELLPLVWFSGFRDTASMSVIRTGLNNPPGNAYLMQRYFLHTDVHLGERFRFFGELASSLVNGRTEGRDRA